MPYRKVLIIRLSALGDVAMTIPVVYSVCRAYPETTFVMLTQKVASQLFINAPRNLQVVVADVKGRHKGFVGLYHLAREVRRLSIDAVADLHDVLRTKVLRFFFKLWGIRVAVIERKTGINVSQGESVASAPFLFRTVRRGFCFARV